MHTRHILVVTVITSFEAPKKTYAHSFARGLVCPNLITAHETFERPLTNSEIPLHPGETPSSFYILILVAMEYLDHATKLPTDTSRSIN